MKADARPDDLPKALAPLIALPHWVIWRWETTKGGKRTKVPYQAARPNGKATSTDPRTWSDFANAAAAGKNADGIGFCLLNSGYGAFDIDDCRDPASGAIDPWAEKLVARAGSYAEVTVLGTGLRIIGRATGSKIHRKQAVTDGVTLETYRGAERYIVMTGDVLPGSPAVLADLDEIMDAVVAELDTGVKHEGTTHNEEIELDWAEVEKHAGWLNNEADLPSDFNTKGKMIVAHIGPIKDLNLDLKQAGLIEKTYNSWSAVSLALAAIFKADGRFTLERIAAALMCDLECNKHVTKLKDAPKRRAVARLLSRSHEPPAKRVARLLNWRECRANGAPVPSMHNARLAITALGIDCSYDTFHKKILFGFRGDNVQHELQSILGEVTDNGIICLRQIMSDRFGVDLEDKATRDAVKSLALGHCFDPVRDMLDKAEADYDGVERLDKMAVTYFNCDDTPLNRAIVRKTMIAAVRRVRKPGCKFDTITVMESDEGWNKSSAWRVIAGDENFSDASILAHGAREVQEQLSEVWIHENADLAGMRKAEVESVKAFASRQSDDARPAYGHFLVKQKRHSIEVATTNSDEYLQSQTGNRRFWPLTVRKMIDLDLLRRPRL